MKLGIAVLLSTLGLSACGSGGHSDDTDESRPRSGESFESDDPGYNGSPGDADSGGGGNAGAPQDDGDGEAERAIAEADIVQVQDNRLYALSRSGGLSIIDVSVKDKLKLLGRHRIQATPFEMYVRGDLVLAMFSSWGKYVYDEAAKTYQWVQTSQVVALDARDPSSMREIGHFELPGEISDSRIVGDVLYVVSYQSGYCWGCAAQPTTVVTSIDVSDPTSIRRVDQLDFASKQGQWGWSKRSVTVTKDRMYVAGPEWASNGTATSTIQVVDISNPHGDMELGASVKAAGTISSRWQMDEHQGVLRVISQPDQWDLSKPPRVQTFEVASSDELNKLGSLTLKLPRPEQLRSVRFDGTRAYAITFERTDPLFTIDLSNPAVPQQKGELEMPGWIHHMEPRGDRLYGLGFDNGNKQGSLNVSIFDVSDLSHPAMLDRVNFGGDWSYLGEDQDRIHKAFQVLPDAGLVLVPFSGYRYGQSCGSYTSGVQLIDLAGDTLTKRGVAPSRGEARRAFLHQDRLFTVSDERAEVFDIDNRDKPKSTASMKLAHRVDRLLPAGENLVRISLDWWTNAASLEVVKADDANRYEPLGSIDLDGALVSSGDPTCGYGAYRYSWARMFADGNRVYVLVPSLYWDSGKPGTTVLVVDIENPAAPRIVNRLHYSFTFSPWDQTGQNWSNTVMQAGSNVVQVGHAIAVLPDGYQSYGYGTSELDSIVHVLDFEDPQAPKHSQIELPTASGRTGLQAHGNQLMFGRWSPVPEKPGRVRFFVDRIDVTKPSEPVLLPSVNVPGSLLSFDEASQRFVTVDYRRDVFAAPSWDGCKGGYFDYSAKTCTMVHRALKLLDLQGNGAKLVDSEELADDLWVGEIKRGDDRVFLVKTYGSYYGYADGACMDGYGYDYGCGYGGREIMVVGGARAGKLRVVTPKLSDELRGLGMIAPVGQRLVVTSGWDASAGLLDLSNLDKPTTTKLGSLYGYAQEIAVEQGRAFFALSNDGVQSFTLPR